MVVSACVRESHLWQHIKVMPLTINMRVQRLLAEGHDAQKQQGFADLLLQVGEGRAGNPMPVPQGMCAPTQDPQHLINTIFGDLSDLNNATAQHMTSRAILTPRNDDVNIINDTVMANFPGGLKVLRQLHEYCVSILFLGVVCGPCNPLLDVSVVNSQFFEF